MRRLDSRSIYTLAQESVVEDASLNKSTTSAAEDKQWIDNRKLDNNNDQDIFYGLLKDGVEANIAVDGYEIIESLLKGHHRIPISVHRYVGC